MKLLHQTVPPKWVFAAILFTVLALTFRVRDVLASNQEAEAEHLLVHAHTAYTAGDYAEALRIAEDAVAEAPNSALVLVKASDYAFVLGMSRYERAEYWHMEAFEAGLHYSTRAHRIDPEDAEVHRAWAEGLLFAYLYEYPVSTDEVRESWNALPVASQADRAYRDTALRIINNGKATAGKR